MKSCLLSSLALACVVALAFVMLPHDRVEAHCQVPCGIYDDRARIHAMLEDVTTITKAVSQINELSKSDKPLNLNQSARWIMTKEQHASHIITTVAEYFLTQKVKDVAPGSTGYEEYLGQLAIHHRVMRAAMKTKQTVDSQDVVRLKVAVEDLGRLYPGK